MLADVVEVGGLERERDLLRRLDAAGETRRATSGALVAPVEHRHVREERFALQLILEEQFVQGDQSRLRKEAGELGDALDVVSVLVYLRLVLVER